MLNTRRSWLMQLKMMLFGKLDNGGRVFVKENALCHLESRNLSASGMGNDATVEYSQLLDETFSVSGTGIRDQTALRTLQELHQDAMPSMIAIILLIITLHMLSVNRGGDHFWSEIQIKHLIAD